MKLEEDSNCEKCGEPETAIHLITECPAYAGARMATLGRPTLEPEDIRNRPAWQILRFAEKTGRWKAKETEEQEITQEQHQT